METNKKKSEKENESHIAKQCFDTWRAPETVCQATNQFQKVFAKPATLLSL